LKDDFILLFIGALKSYH